MGRDGLVHVIAPPHSHPIKAPWLRPYRTALLDPADISVRRSDGIALTSPARTAVDLARWLRADDLRSVIDQIEHALIDKALSRCGGVKTKAADFLGINRNTLNKKVKELGIEAVE